MGDLVDTKNVLKFLGLETVTTADKNIEMIIAGVEEWVKGYCNEDFKSVTYKERLDGTGTQELYLDNTPVTALYRLSIDSIEGLLIKNTASGFHASVSVNSTGMILYKDGATVTLSFTTYTTLATLVTAINAQSGWSARLIVSSYGTFPSTCLEEVFGLQCIDNHEISLYIPDFGEYDFEVYPEEGKIFLYAGFPEGRKNIYVEYVAGYTTIPNDLQLAVHILIKAIYQRRAEETFGVTSFSLSGISASFEQSGIPIQAKEILNRYKSFVMAEG